MDEIKCRTCLEVTDIQKCVEVTQTCYFNKAVKDVIIFLVPEMASTLMDDELICENCLNTVRLSIEFIERCLEVEQIYAENREQYENVEYIDDYSEDNGEDTKFQNTVNDEQYENIEYDFLDNHESGDFVKERKTKLFKPVQYVGGTLDNGEDNDEDAEDTDLFMEKIPRSCNDHDYHVKTEIEEDIKEEPDDSVSLGSEENENDDTFYDYNSDSGAAEIIYEPSVSNDQNLEEGSGPIQIVFEDSSIQYEEATDSQDDNFELKGDEISEGDVSENIQTEAEGTDNERDHNYSCLHCPLVFLSKEDYRLHLETHPSFVCHLCGKRLKNDDSYRNHMRVHNENYVTICEFCGKSFRCNSALNLHITSTHMEERLYMCDKCPKQFKNQFKLRNHIKVVHQKIGRQQCQQCGKLFQNKEACANHYRLIHLQLKPYSCDVCGMEFGRKDYLKKHMFNHTGQPRSLKKDGRQMKRPRLGIRLKDPGKPVTCNVCGKQISTVHLLRAHLQTHVRIKRHKCSLCELTFTLAANRDRHEKLHDSDPHNKFRCNICWKRVKTQEALESHILGHSNRPPQHSCAICGEKFHRKYLLDNHLLDKHTGPGDIERAEEEIVMKNLLKYADAVLL